MKFGVINCGAVSPVAQQIKNLLAMKETQETRVQSLGGKYTLEEDLAKDASILTWKILWTEGPSRLQSVRSQRVQHD